MLAHQIRPGVPPVRTVQLFHIGSLVSSLTLESIFSDSCPYGADRKSLVTLPRQDKRNSW